MMDFVNALSDLLWTYVVIVLLVGCALYFTIRLRAVQFTRIGEMVRLLTSTNRTKEGQEGKHVSSFQAFVVSLGSRVGTGNLAGVASAIFVGGPGAIFWMWVMALFGAATACMESTLAQLYKRRGEGSFYGGPAYYMQYGLHRKWMGMLFAVFIIFGFGIANQLVQSNTLCEALSVAFHVDIHWVSVVLAAFTLVIVFGGIHRIARFTAVVVPFMAIGYILLAIYILAVNVEKIPDMFMLIVRSAFGKEQAFGGLVGTAIMMGVRRGLFSNEAGEGSTPNAAATATISHPVKQGMIQSLGVFVDTLVICSCTAFIILLSGVYTDGSDGIILTNHAMEYHLGSMGIWYLTIAITLFAYSTIIGNYFYGEVNLRFLTKNRWPLTVFRIITGGLVILSCEMTLQQAWGVVDLAMAFMTILNLVAVILLSRWAFRLMDDYRKQRKEGRDPEFHREQFPEIEDDLEAW